MINFINILLIIFLYLLHYQKELIHKLIIDIRKHLEKPNLKPKEKKKIKIILNLFSESSKINFEKNLNPREIIYYRIDNYQHFKKPKTFRICFGSCNVNIRNKTIWEDISSFSPNLWIFMGDNYYNDYIIQEEQVSEKEGDVLLNHLDIIEELKNNSSYQKFLNTHKHLAIWDDHDYYTNNKDFDTRPSLKKLLKKSFLELYQIKNNDIRYKRDGIYTLYDLVYHDKVKARFFLLDVRTFKSNLDILGKSQWEWLENNIKNSPAEINILISGTCFINDNSKNESWTKHGWSMKKLEELLENYHLKNVLLLSGDIHQGKVTVKNHLIEVTSSPLTSKVSNWDNHPLVGKPVKQNNFGFIDIDLARNNYHTGLVDLKQGKFHNIINFKLK